MLERESGRESGRYSETAAETVDVGKTFAGVGGRFQTGLDSYTSRHSICHNSGRVRH